MGRVNTLILTTEQQKALENGFKHGASHCFRMRCQSVLLKADGRKPILSQSEDWESILAAIKGDRQRMRTAKAQWESESGEKVCDTTFKAFLKTLADD